jgi:hypothetical protein
MGQAPLSSSVSAQSLSSAASSASPSCTQPPQNVDLMTLPDAELLALGFPTHSILDAQPALWAELLAHSKQRVCDRGALARHKSAPLTPRVVGDGCGSTPNAMCHSINWAGAEDVGSGRGAYREADMEFYVPTVPSSPSNSVASYWAGVGGNTYVTSNAVLVQAGVDTWYNGYRESWVEVEPNLGRSYNLPLCRLNASDDVVITVNSNYGNNGYDFFSINNVTANCYNSCTVHTDNTSIHDTCGFTGGSSFNSDSATGEIIVERLNPNPLAEFSQPGQISGEVKLRNCHVNTFTIGSQTHNFSEIVNSSDTEALAIPNISIPNNTDVIVYWYHGT